LPGWRVHVFVDKVFLGKSYRKIHEKMDAPVVFLGRGHRKLFHDPITASIIANKYYPNDPKAVASANLHIALDKLCTANPAYKKYLEGIEKLRRKKRPKKRKRAPEKREPWLDPLMNDFKKIEEIKRLLRAISSYR